jgi:bacterial/archaeal transporter family-2 protein
LSQGVALVVMALAGAAIAFQGPINARLGERIGQMPATGVSMIVGTTLLGVLVVVTGKVGGLGGVTDVSPIYLTGGLIGAVFVLTAIVTVRVVGAGGFSAALITGQLAAATLIVDRLGVLGLQRIPVSEQRLAGIALLIAGTVAIAGRH